MSDSAVVQNHAEVEAVLNNINDALQVINGENLVYEFEYALVDMEAFSNYQVQMDNIIKPSVLKFQTNFTSALKTIGKNVEEYDFLEKRIVSKINTFEEANFKKETI